MELKLPNAPGDLPRLTAAVDAFVARHGLGVAEARALHVALLEHVTNVVVHGGDGGGEVRVRLWLEAGGGVVWAEVEDGGRRFDPTLHPVPDLSVPLEDRPMGGLGIHLMRRMTDGLEYRRVGGRNVLRLWKRVTALGGGR